MPSLFPPTPWVKTRRLNVWKTSYGSSTYFAYFNSWQKVDEETSVMKFGDHSRAYLEGLTKFWGSSVYSSPPYSPYCTLKFLTFDPKPFLNPKNYWRWWLLIWVRKVLSTISEHHGYGYTRGFCAGFAAGTGTGTWICTRTRTCTRGAYPSLIR
jgi:hypothetical protein